jgi:hypothetical protein
MKENIAVALGAVLTIGAVATAQAQSAPGAPGSSQVIPEKRQPPLDNLDVKTGRSGSLSDKLDSSNGVVKPMQNVDPGMTKAPAVPDANATPVIHPPGTPGGPPGPQAK